MDDESGYRRTTSTAEKENAAQSTDRAALLQDPRVRSD